MLKVLTDVKLAEAEPIVFRHLNEVCILQEILEVQLPYKIAWLCWSQQSDPHK